MRHTDSMASTWDDLPFVDEHGVTIRADLDAVFDATVAVLRSSGGEFLRRYARLVGSEHRTSAGTGDLSAGDTVVGFRVVASERPREIVLHGSHRFAIYRLGFLIERARDGETILRARTDAAFPGAAGRIYRACVIGSRGHRVVVRRLLRRVARRAVMR